MLLLILVVQYTHYCNVLTIPILELILFLLLTLAYTVDDDGDDEEGTASGGKEYSVSYEGNDQLRHKVMEPDEGKPPELPVIKEYTAEEERSNIRRYRTVTVGDVSVQIDMQAVEPYRKIIQHMGESCDPLNVSCDPWSVSYDDYRGTTV